MAILRIEVVSGEIQIIRKELNPAELYPDNLRYNPTTGEVGYTPDDGATWIPAPELDPRHAGNIPPRPGSDIVCQSGGSVAEYVKRYINMIVPLLSASATLVQGASSIVGFLGILSSGYAVLWSAITGVFATLVGYGATTIGSAFDDDVYHQIACNLQCNMNSNGQMDQSHLDAAKTDITNNIGGTAAEVTNLLLDLMGFAGVNRAASFYTTDTDCADCDCNNTWCYDFVAAGRLSAFTPWPGAGGHMVGGEWRADWVTPANTMQLDIDVTFARTYITSIEITFTNNKNNGGRPTTLLYDGAAQVYRHDTGYAASSVQTHVTYTIAPNKDATRLRLANIANTNGTLATIENVVVRGNGDNPFGSDNCN